MSNLTSRISKAIVSEREFTRDTKKLLGLLFGILAIVAGSLWYVSSGWGGFLRMMTWPWESSWINTTFSTKLTFQFPGFLNSLWGLALCFPIYLRNFIPFKVLSPYSYLSFVLNFCLFSVIAQLIFGSSGSFTHNTMNTIFIASIVITWIGMRAVAGFGWIAVFVLAVVNLISADYHLKQFGLPFVLCAFSSFLFQTQFSPKELFGNLLSDFRGFEQSQGVVIKESMSEAAKTGGKVIVRVGKTVL